jgi:hypothetical protein
MSHDPAGHVAMERLAAYRAGELAPEEAEAVQDHLAACRECASALLDLARYGALMESDEPLPAGAGVPAPEETAAAWQRLRARLAPAAAPAPERSPETAGTVLPFDRAFRKAGGPVLVSALAAALAACLIGFPWWIATHRGAPLGLAVPGSEVHRGGGGSMPLTVHLGEASGVVAVPLPERELFPVYRVEIRSLQGMLQVAATTAPAAVAVPPAGGAGSRSPVVTIVLPAASLPAGEYRLRLVGVHGEAGEVLAEHSLRVEL